VVTGSRQNKWGQSEQYKTTASRHFRNRKRKYLKNKIDELATNSENKNIRDMYREIN
jgi:hypothetical protein